MKTFDKIQHLFLVKTVNTLEIGENFLSLIRTSVNILQPTSYLPPTIKNMTRVPALATAVQCGTGDSS